jgi:hypothetical protein
MADCRKAGERSVEELPRATPPHVRDQADAARIAVAARVVEKALRVAHRAGSFRREEDSPAGWF